MQHHGKKLCALLLSLCMIISFVPVSAQAAILDGEDYIMQQLCLGDDLVLHLSGDVPEEYRSGSTATITYAGQTDQYTIQDLTPDENGRYDLPVELAVPQMTEEIKLVLKAKLGLISVEAINETYSIREYLKTLIDGNYTRETKQLAQELLNYGAWAQKYFNYKTDNLANKGYDITVSNPMPAKAPNIAIKGNVPGLEVKGVTLRLLSKTAVKFYFAAENGIDGMTFTVDGTQYKPSVNADGLYYVEVGGVMPKNMDNKMNVAVTDGENTVSFSYAPIEFFVRSYHNTTDDTYKGLMEAGYSYFMACQAFDGVTDTGKLTMEYVGGDANSIQVETNLPTDIPLADFALTDNGCNVNEDANLSQKASKVGMSNVNGKIVLIFNFDNNFEAGQTYSLPKNAFFCFTDNSQYALAQDYLFQFDGTDWTQVEVSGDFTYGVDFEQIGNTLLFTGEGPASKAATITRVAHATEIPQLSNGGNYALKLTHASSYYPTFRINFGKELAAGTKISFMAFGIILGDSQYDNSVFEFNDGGDATVQFACGEWTQLIMTLPENADHIDLFWNFERASLTDTNTTGAVYVDNFVAIEPVEPEGNFLQGVNFETAGNAALFEGQGIVNRDAIIVRVPYANTEISAPANGGDYALKLSHPSNYWPTFRINFGKELAAGTTITFDAYGKINGESMDNQSIFEYMAGGEATAQFKCDTWTKLTMTLTEATDHIDLFWNIDRANITSATASGEVYLDNFVAIEPVEISGDILEGLDFEDAGNALWFTGIGDYQAATVETVTYADAGVAAPANGGSYALKVSHASNCWPNFRLNFGKTLKAGTTITFDVYGNYDHEAAGATKYMKLELTADSKNFATSADPNQIVWTLVETWKTGVSITLTADSDHVDFFYNVADGQHGDVSSWILLDNFKAEETVVTEDADFLAGVTFETLGHEAGFSGITQDTNVERAAYADTGVSAPANGGNYALKVSHASNCWPNFRVDFGKTLKAGTIITFDVYGNYDYEAAGATKYMKLELTADSKNFATSEDPRQILWTVVETWRTGVGITLTADSDHVDLFYNVADGSHGDNLSSWILLDNFKAEEPVLISNGLTFDNSSDAECFTGVGGDNAWRDASFEIVSFDGDNALKLTCASSQWPTFRINFGETLPAGTVITFDAYTDDTSGIRNTVSVFESMANWSGTTIEYLHGSWNAQTITLTADCSYVDIMCNMDRWSEPGPANMAVYLDNFQVDLPFSYGVNFENADHINYFGGVGGDNAWRDASFEIVSFDGDKALKLTCASSQWPTFRINFGETLAAGTTITFDAYTDDTSGIRNTVSVFESMANWSGTTIEYLHGSWNAQTITLTADCSYVDIMCNMDRWNEPGPANMVVYIDDITVNAA